MILARFYTVVEEQAAPRTGRAFEEPVVYQEQTKDK